MVAHGCPHHINQAAYLFSSPGLRSCVERLLTASAAVQEDGSMRPSAQQAERLIEQALQMDPSSAQAQHLHIHIAEAGSPLR